MSTEQKLEQLVDALASYFNNAAECGAQRYDASHPGCQNCYVADSDMCKKTGELQGSLAALQAEFAARRKHSEDVKSTGADRCNENRDLPGRPPIPSHKRSTHHVPKV